MKPKCNVYLKNINYLCLTFRCINLWYINLTNYIYVKKNAIFFCSGNAYAHYVS